MAHSLPQVLDFLETVKIQSAIFERGAASFEDCPDSRFPEFAFIGRSNVGKSSLINLLAGSEGLARVSGNPGRTREINFFTVNDQWSLVDLPGYGYAKVSKADRERFQEFIAAYLIERENLFCAFVLIDSRHSPQRIDLEFVQWLVEGGVPFALVFTKADKSKPAVARKNVTLFLDAMKAWSEGEPAVFTTSAKTREGRKEILDFIENALLG